MFKRFGLIAMTALLASGSGCPPRESTPDNPNPFLPRSWAQENADKENSGFNAVHTDFALPPFKKWSAPVGILSRGGPVVAPSGVIYVGNTAGELVALNSDGTEHLRRKLDESILTSPAVNTQTGDVFVIGQRPGDGDRLESHLFHLDSGFGLHSISQDPFSTTAAPRLWRDFVFVQSDRELLVFDQASLALVGRISVGGCINLVCGGSAVRDWLPAEINILLCVVEDPPTSPDELIGCVSNSDNPREPSPPLPFEASVAIVDSPALVGDANRPIVVVVTNQCATALRFFPDGDGPVQGVPPIDRHFDPLWSFPLVEVDCDFDTVRSASPAAVLGGQVIIGDQDARVLSLDLLTGQKLWERKLEEAFFVFATPAAFLRQIYVPTQGGLFVLDSDGEVLSKTPLRGYGGGVALSLDFVYVTTREGVHTFSLDPTEGFAFDGTLFGDTQIGESLPALAEDGTLYVSEPAGFVHAYAPGGSFGSVIVPVVSWQIPTNAATLTSASGKTLQVAVSRSNGTFTGTVSLVSNMDGPLCDNITPSGSTAACTTTRALSPGPHTFTAFANDVSGGTNSAQITVNVVSTPPTVTIASPANNAVFGKNATITFTAQVSDPDQSSFTSDKIQWQSSIDGNIGSGLSFSKKLSLGTHTITAIATDQAGQTGSANVTIQVTQGPIVTILEPAENFMQNSVTEITFKASVVDSTEPNFPAASVKWKSDLDGDLGTGFTIKRKLSIGTHTITVTATDKQGLSGQATVHVVIFLILL